MFLINTEEKVDIVTPTRESMRKRWSTTSQVRRLSQFCQQAGNKPLKLNALPLCCQFLIRFCTVPFDYGSCSSRDTNSPREEFGFQARYDKPTLRLITALLELDFRGNSCAPPFDLVRAQSTWQIVSYANFGPLKLALWSVLL